MPKKKTETFTCPDCGATTTEAGLCQACKDAYAKASDNEGQGAVENEGGAEDGNTEA